MDRFPQDELVYMGIDLSTVRDLASTCMMFPPNPDREYYPDPTAWTATSKSNT